VAECQYFCRGCGQPLPAGFPGLFHRGCLCRDKRRRTQEKRRLEGQRFEAWLKRHRCRACGAEIGAERTPGGQALPESTREASRAPLSHGAPEDEERSLTAPHGMEIIRKER
jgi:hypothetical protein